MKEPNNKYGVLRIDPEILEKAKASKSFVFDLVESNKMHFATVERWITNNEVYLTLENNQRIIRKHAKIKEGKNIIVEIVPK